MSGHDATVSALPFEDVRDFSELPARRYLKLIPPDPDARRWSVVLLPAAVLTLDLPTR